MKEKKMKTSKLATYTVIMLLTVIIIIIIAAMADDRESNFQSQIEQTTQANATIQEEVVRLKNENYDLKTELEKIKEENLTLTDSNSICGKLSETQTLLNDEKVDEAEAKLAEINEETVPEELKSLYDTVKATVLSKKTETK